MIGAPDNLTELVLNLESALFGEFELNITRLGGRTGDRPVLILNKSGRVTYRRYGLHRDDAKLALAA